MNHFLVLNDRTPEQLRWIFDRAHAVKKSRKEGKVETTLAGKTLGLIFEKPSTRTRLSFEAAIAQLGGSAVTLVASESQLARGETLEDTARTVSRYVDVIMLRTFGDERLRAFATAATVPVINGLSDGAHPVQLLADLMTVEEKLGGFKGKEIAFIGDAASNMGRSWVEAAKLFDFHLRLGAPAKYLPPENELKAAGKHVTVTADPREAARGADVITTDTWTSMGQEQESAWRRADFKGFTVDDAMMALGKPGAIFLHCLPAHRGEEVTDSVIDGKQSVVFDEAENRMHVQKALLEQTLLRK
jgi:ornithine carbamoyltransferase